MKKKKILFLYNGGTIGQVPVKVGDKIVSGPPKDASIFKKAMRTSYCGEVTETSMS